MPRLIANRYVLERALARDDLAECWLASDTLLERDVEVRLLRAEVADDPSAARRLRGDPRARLLDGGTDEVPFAVFEWLDDRASAGATRAEQSATSRLTTVTGVATPTSAPRAEKSRRAPSQPSAAARPPRAEPRPPTRADSRGRNLAVPVILTCLPLAVGVIVVAKIISGQSMIQLPAPGLVLPAPQAVASPAVAVAEAAAAPTTVQRATTPTPARQASPTASPVAGERVRVANTDGIGVALRDGPGGNRLPGKGYDEGATVTVLERRGAWAHIRGDDGREGWVLAVTVPASGRGSN